MTSGDEGPDVQAVLKELTVLRRECVEVLAEARDSFAWSSVTEALLVALVCDHPHPEAVLSRLLDQLDGLADIPHLTKSRTFADTAARYRAVLEKLSAARRT